MENEAKMVRVEIVRANIDGVEDIKEIVKAVGNLSDVYKKLYDSIKVEIVDSTFIVPDKVTKTQGVIMSGIRAEKEDEHDERVGVDSKDDRYWKCKYSKLTGCDKKEAEKNMEDMLKENLMLTPEDWLAHKKKKIEDFFNVGKKINK